MIFESEKDARYGLMARQSISPTQYSGKWYMATVKGQVELLRSKEPLRESARQAGMPFLIIHTLT